MDLDHWGPLTDVPYTQPSERFTRAVAFAVDVHWARSRAGTRVPALAHLLAAAALVLEDGGDEDEAIAALLHDAGQDSARAIDGQHDAGEDRATDETVERVHAAFGARVAALVAACAEAHGDRHPGGWSAGRQHTVDALADVDPAAARVLLADALHNARCLLTDLAEQGPRVWDWFRAGRDDQLWYYAALSEVARCRFRGSRLIGELARAVEQLEQAAYRATAPRNPSDWDGASAARRRREPHEAPPSRTAVAIEVALTSRTSGTPADPPGEDHLHRPPAKRLRLPARRVRPRRSCRCR